ncbi:MAG: tRNA lysidine(34) synthetase TilS [Nitrospinaceae bacterium]
MVAAVSGGPDSVAMLHVLHALRSELGIRLTVAHLNHCTRGEESAEDAEFVRRMAEELEAPCTVGRWESGRTAKESSGSFQDKARQARRDFLKDTAGKLGGARIALGHTADDQAETVLMNFLRGSGSRGLGGMPPARGPFVRPLIEATRREVLAFLRDRKIGFREDPSNLERNYLRNQVRWDLIPLLEKEYQPNLRPHLAHLAGLLREEDAYLTQVAADCLDSHILQPLTAGRLVLDGEKLGLLPVVLRRRVIREALLKVKGNLRAVEWIHVERVMAVGPGNKSTFLPGNIRVLEQEGRLLFEKILPRPPRIQIEDTDRPPVKIAIPGETGFGLPDFKFHANLLAPGQCNFIGAGEHQAYLDFDRTGDAVWARLPRRGDRFSPLGMDGTKKLKSFFIDSGIAPEERWTTPVLTTDQGDIIWVYGRRISHLYRVTDSTRKVLFIEGSV